MMDVVSLTSLLADGQDVNALLDQELLFDVSNTHLSYGSYISTKVRVKGTPIGQ